MIPPPTKAAPGYKQDGVILFLNIIDGGLEDDQPKIC